MTPADVDRFDRAGVHVWNYYGPTEATFWATCHDFGEPYRGGDAPIGGALPRYRTSWWNRAVLRKAAEQDATVFRPLVELVVGGDLLSTRHADLVLAACPGLRLVNAYGPTENTAFSTVYPLDRAHPARALIGSPVPNSTAYVVDLDGHLQPVGVPGELL